MSASAGPAGAAAAGTIHVVGAGIGGLTLAAALRLGGREVVVHERARVITPVGAGLSLQINAMRALGRLGLDGGVGSAGAVVDTAAILNRGGGTLATTDFRPMAAELGHPVIAIHRARLHEVLLAAVGPDTVRLGREVVAVEGSADAPELVFADGERQRAALVVGADGLRSAVRRHVTGATEEPVYAGYTSWRGVSPAAGLARVGHVTESWGRGARFGVVPLGHGEIYWFATADAPAGGKDGDAHAELAARFDGWHEPVAALVASTPPGKIVRTDISDRPPLSTWRRGAVVLLGDAAHPMTPNLGQGACQAIEDALWLAHALTRGGGGLGEALQAYERARVERANRVVRDARRFGVMGQWKNPLAAWVRNLGARLAPASMAEKQLRALFAVELP